MTHCTLPSIGRAAFINHASARPLSASRGSLNVPHCSKRPTTSTFTGIALRSRRTRQLPRSVIKASVAESSSTANQNGAPKPDTSETSQISPSVITTLREIILAVRQLAIPLWGGDRKTTAWLWTIATVVLAFFATLYTVMLSMVQKFFWNTLSAKDATKFGKLLAFYALTVTIGPIVLSVFDWVKQRLALMWRRALSEHLLKRYFTANNYYKLSLGGTAIDNPDQRISEDVMKFTDRAVRFFTIMGVAAFDLIIFSVILYRVYSPLLFALIAYAGIGTTVIAITGRRLVRLNQRQVIREADFRFGLVRVREATESVAFYGGEEAEKKELFERFISLFRNKLTLLGLKRNVEFLSTSFRYWAQVVPTIVIAPQYFAGKVALGTISQVYFSFNHVLSSLGLIANEFTALTEFSAGVGRLKGIADVLEKMDAEMSETRIETEFDTCADAKGLSVHSLSVLTPSTPPKLLVQNLDFEVKDGERFLVVGRSGIGKSSLMRAICGLWDSGEGKVKRPGRDNTLFLPQRPFVMLGTLRENVIYPSQREDVTDEEVTNALNTVNLKYLLKSNDGLDTAGEVLTRQLSLGEQQRLAFARVVISRPSVVILDESSSALDLENERDMYKMIARLGVTCISVGNRPSLLDFHQKVLSLGSDGEWMIEGADEVKLRRNGQSLNV